MVTSSRGSDLWNHLGVQAKREIDWWMVSKENQEAISGYAAYQNDPRSHSLRG